MESFEKPAGASLKDPDSIADALCLIEGDMLMANGFFTTYTLGQDKVTALMTTYNFIGKDLIDAKATIKISLRNGTTFELELDENNRRISTFEDAQLTVIEIAPQEIPTLNKFLEVDQNFFSKGPSFYKDHSIFLVQQSLGWKTKVSKGEIKEINDNYFSFKHNALADRGSGASPIVSGETLKVIGIHWGINEVDAAELHNATFLGFVIGNMGSGNSLPPLPSLSTPQGDEAERARAAEIGKIYPARININIYSM